MANGEAILVFAYFGVDWRDYSAQSGLVAVAPAGTAPRAERPNRGRVERAARAAHRPTGFAG
ncbi:MAG: hypothetical protein D6768_10635 [Chloroflexi bacterium]|nr:MAG: hypothetical protein D6768_10635 [Chloroflexota bacterium]